MNLANEYGSRVMFTAWREGMVSGEVCSSSGGGKSVLGIDTSGKLKE